jgi:hypothetical protein
VNHKSAGGGENECMEDDDCGSVNGEGMGRWEGKGGGKGEGSGKGEGKRLGVGGGGILGICIIMLGRHSPPA